MEGIAIIKNDMMASITRWSSF